MSGIRDHIDLMIGKLTMYHIVVQGLVLLIVASFVLMLTGYLPYSPVSFAASLVLFCGGSYAANKLFGWLFGVRSHAESAVITGLILALLFSPPESMLDGVKLLLVAAIAMASKYVIALRAKHIFNPAAIAIVIASIGQLAYASWWVATPALLPFTIVAAALILYKTEKIRVGLVFLVVAVGLITLQMIAAGQISTAALSAALTSWPLVFFAGVMLSEPQTLPPRRWQQYSIAALVGVLVVTPFHYGPVLMTPALALVIGNAVAFYMGIQRNVTLRLVSKKQIGKNGYELTFDVKPFAFEPGQYVELSLPHAHMDLRGMRRVFTLIGRSNATQVSIATRLPEKSSSFKRAFTNMKNGQIVYGTRVAGDFVLPRDPSIPIVFIAGGIGITPLISFIMSEQKRDITLIYSVASLSDMFFVDELRRYDVTVIVVTSQGGKLPDSSWKLVTGKLSAQVIGDVTRSDGHPPHVYVSGSPKMVKEAVALAKEAGVRTIRTDQFTGY